MMNIRAKKALGQHFLKDESIARRITESLILPDKGQGNIKNTLQTINPEDHLHPGSGDQQGKNKEENPASILQVLEIGPGTGVLTKYLLGNPRIKLELAEIDTESVDYLRSNYPQLLYTLQKRDFLTMPLDNLFKEEFAIIGNFPYNISSQIFFKILDHKERISQVVCMLQKEVAERLASPPGNKSYGILSVLLQAWYNIEYLFTVNENVFLPPPKVKSGVIRLTRNSRTSLDCDHGLFRQIIKTCFNQRRKTIRNSIKPVTTAKGVTLPDNKLLDMRPEQLSVEQFVELTKLVSSNLPERL